MKVYRLITEWVDFEGEEGTVDRGVYSSFASMKEVLMDILQEDLESTSEKYRLTRKVDYLLDRVEVYNGIYRHQTHLVIEYELDVRRR